MQAAIKADLIKRLSVKQQEQREALAQLESALVVAGGAAAR